MRGGHRIQTRDLPIARARRMWATVLSARGHAPVSSCRLDGIGDGSHTSRLSGLHRPPVGRADSPLLP